MSTLIHDCRFASRHGFYDEVLRRVRALPGLVSADVVNLPPMGVDNVGNTFRIAGKPPLPPRANTRSLNGALSALVIFRP